MKQLVRHLEQDAYQAKAPHTTHDHLPQVASLGGHQLWRLQHVQQCERPCPSTEDTCKHFSWEGYLRQLGVWDLHYFHCLLISNQGQ